jgi:hypothetical protein
MFFLKLNTRIYNPSSTEQKKVKIVAYMILRGLPCNSIADSPSARYGYYRSYSDLIRGIQNAAFCHNRFQFEITNSKFYYSVCSGTHDDQRGLMRRGACDALCIPLGNKLINFSDILLGRNGSIKAYLIRDG